MHRSQLTITSHHGRSSEEPADTMEAPSKTCAQVPKQLTGLPKFRDVFDRNAIGEHDVPLALGLPSLCGRFRFLSRKLTTGNLHCRLLLSLHVRKSKWKTLYCHGDGDRHDEKATISLCRLTQPPIAEEKPPHTDPDNMQEARWLQPCRMCRKHCNLQHQKQREKAISSS